MSLSKPSVYSINFFYDVFYSHTIQRLAHSLGLESPKINKACKNYFIKDKFTNEDLVIMYDWIMRGNILFEEAPLFVNFIKLLHCLEIRKINDSIIYEQAVRDYETLAELRPTDM